MRNVPDLPCLDCVAYRNYRTDSLGLTIQNGAESRFVPWEDITDAETVDAPETGQFYYVLTTRDGDAFDVPYDNSHFAASLWQHLRTRGLHWFIDLFIEVENFWWPIPKCIPYEMKWKCRDRQLRRMDDVAAAFLVTSDGFEAKTAAGVVRSEWDSVNRACWVDTAVHISTSSGVRVVVPWDPKGRHSMELLLAVIRRLRDVRQPVCVSI